jgi:hypothetical protein
VPNAPEEMVIAAAVEGLAIGKCIAHFARNYPYFHKGVVRGDETIRKVRR